MPYKDNEKQKEVLHRYYVENTHDFRARKRKDVGAKRAYTNEIKSVPCADCGNTFPPCAMDFDHRDPLKKVTRVSKLVHLSWERLKTEIEKCDVVCANCHRIRTYKKGLNRLTREKTLREYSK